MAAPMLAFPSFFKVINNHKQKEETGIPKFIAINYWKGLSNPIFLRLPNGVEREIFWEKRGDGIWLHKNWKNFAELNSLRFGSFLVFDYTGESRFQVRIFNPNNSECKYYNEGSHHEQVEKRSEPVVILDDSKTNNVGPSKRTNNSGMKRSHREQVVKRSEPIVIIEDSGTNNIGPSKRTNNYGMKRSEPVLILEDSGTNPIGPSKRTNNGMKHSHHEQVEKRREPVVILEDSETNNIGPSKRTNKNGKKKIKVDFDDANHKEVSGAGRGGSKAEAIEEITRNFESKIENPFCVVILPPTYVQHHQLAMPSDFSRKHLYRLNGIATIGIGQNSTSTWGVRFYYDYAREGTRFGKGWWTFCQDNNLQVGDACIFELLKCDPVTFKVHVSIEL